MENPSICIRGYAVSLCAYWLFSKSIILKFLSLKILIPSLLPNDDFAAPAMTFPTICFRPTQVADLPFVISAEQHADNAPYVNQWSQQRHESAIVAPDFGHFIVEFTGNNALSINMPSINAPPVAVGYLIVSGLQDHNEVLLLNRIVIVQKIDKKITMLKSKSSRCSLLLAQMKKNRIP